LSIRSTKEVIANISFKVGNSLWIRILKAYGEEPDLSGGTAIEVKRLLQAGHRLSDRHEAVILKKPGRQAEPEKKWPAFLKN
jgi:hypothetical protein